MFHKGSVVICLTLLRFQQVWEFAVKKCLQLPGYLLQVTCPNVSRIRMITFLKSENSALRNESLKSLELLVDTTDATSSSWCAEAVKIYPLHSDANQSQGGDMKRKSHWPIAAQEADSAGPPGPVGNLTLTDWRDDVARGAGLHCLL